ncbi:MAG: PIN domain-containing protein [Myxococcota bacterium]
MDPIILVDTDVFSFVFRGDPRANLYEDMLVDRKLALSFMTVAELHQWACTRNWGDARLKSLEDAIGARIIVDSSTNLCREWARVRTTCARAGRPISAQDAWNAAIAMHFKMPLVSHNAKDYEALEELVLWTASE